MALTLINNGDTGLATRTTLNAALTQLNASGAIAGGNRVPAYTGTVMTNCIHPIQVLVGSATQLQSRSVHICQDNITSVQIAMPGCYGATETNPGTTTYQKVAIEYPVGVITPILWSGARPVSASGGNDTVLSDVLPITIPRGATVYFRNIATCAGGVPFVSFNTNCPLMSAEYSTTASLTDKVDSGTIGTLNNTTAITMPVRIIAQTTRASYAEFGDSIGYGQGMGFSTDPYSHEGIITPSLGPSFAFQKAAISGDYLAVFVATSGSNSVRRRARALADCTGIICQLGNNDIFGGAGGAAATLIANITALAAFFPGKPVIPVATLPRPASSSDGRVSVANQVLGAQETERLLYVRRGRTGTIPSTVGWIDPNRALEYQFDTGLWAVGNGTPVQTGDLTHPNTAGYYANYRSGAVDPAQVLLWLQG